MKSRVVMALAVAVLLMGVFVSATKRAGRDAGSGVENGASKAVATARAVDSEDEPMELSGRPNPNETIAERRERMMASDGYRDDLKLSEHDVFLHVQAKGSNAMSLVAAFEATRDKAYLKTAAEKFPNDAFVQMKALMALDLSDDERAKMVDDFKNSAPTNAFANFLAAKEAMKRGDTQAAIAELAAARGKGFNEYFAESAQGLEEIYASVGHSEAEAKVLGSSDVTIPHLAEFKKLGKQFLELAEKAGAAGDTKTQQELAMWNWAIGEKLRSAGGSTTLITELVGIAMENATLRAWPKGVEFAGGTTADILQANNLYRDQLKVAGPAFGAWFPTAPDEEIITYMNTMRSSGESEAMKWLIELHPELKSVKSSDAVITAR